MTNPEDKTSVDPVQPKPASAPQPVSLPIPQQQQSTGELRGALDACAPVTFADLYGLLPLGLSPDPSQAWAGGEPLVSAYLDPAGVRELCAVQLLAQAGLAGHGAGLELPGPLKKPRVGAAVFVELRIMMTGEYGFLVGKVALRVREQRVERRAEGRRFNRIA